MTDRTDAIKAAISATAPSELQQSGAMVIAGRLTAVGETFAGITSGGETMTLSIDADRARWLGQHVGRDVRLTVEVTL